MKTSIPLSRTLRTRRRVVCEMHSYPAKAETQQQFKDECDINLIMKKAKRGIPPAYLNPKVPQYGDFTDVPDIAKAYDLILDAEDAFMNLPAELRLELGNNPANITKLSASQIDRYGLKKAPVLPTLSQPPLTPSEAGQAAPVGTEPTAQSSKKTD